MPPNTQLIGVIIMNVRCPNCRANFTISTEYLTAAYEKSAKKKHKYHAVECIRCRKQVKLPLKDMAKFLPEEESGESEE